MTYVEKIGPKIAEWEQKMFRKPGLLEKTSKKLNKQMNRLIPDKLQTVITATVKGLVKATLFEADYTPKRKVEDKLTLEEADEMARELLGTYRRIAAVEGAATGAGGFMLNMADFPVLLAIQMKYLFELAHVYGYDTSSFSERVFVLSVFQLAFSGTDRRKQHYEHIRNWQAYKPQWITEGDYHLNLDWETFQQDYRDSIDFRKMLQMVPGIGAVAGTWANYTILDELGETGMNCYRIRRMQENQAWG
ncbi:MAG: EcsC family protein [Gorillibacterium sp.]|nr:EcsC family protein [Gorillibacterium sp.]